MKRLERNAVLAGLRYLQYNLLQIPDSIFHILTDGNVENDANHLNAEDIDALCESLNMATYDPAKFEVSRVHQWEDENERTLAETCTIDGCSNEHLFSVYVRNPQRDGRSEWLSDHISEALAVSAAIAYGPDFDEIIAFQH